jgi:hypothetical protein
MQKERKAKRIFTSVQEVKLRLHEVNRETGQVDRLSAPSYLPRVNVYLPEI